MLLSFKLNCQIRSFIEEDYTDYLWSWTLIMNKLGIILIILFVIFVFFPTMSYWINQWSF